MGSGPKGPYSSILNAVEVCSLNMIFLIWLSPIDFFILDLLINCINLFISIDMTKIKGDENSKCNDTNTLKNLSWFDEKFKERERIILGDIINRGKFQLQKSEEKLKLKDIEHESRIPKKKKIVSDCSSIEENKGIWSYKSDITLLKQTDEEENGP